jgi:hypothetical protein
VNLKYLTYCFLGIVAGLSLGFILFSPPKEGEARGGNEKDTGFTRRIHQGIAPELSDRDQPRSVEGSSSESGGTSDPVLIDRSLAQRLPGYLLKADLTVDLAEMEKFGFSHEQSDQFKEIVDDLIYCALDEEKERRIILSEGDAEVTLIIPMNEARANALRHETQKRLDQIQSPGGLRLSDIGMSVLSDVTGDFGGRDRLIQFREEQGGNSVFEILELTPDVIKALDPAKTPFSEYQRAAWKTVRLDGSGELPDRLRHLFTER